MTAQITVIISMIDVADVVMCQGQLLLAWNCDVDDADVITSITTGNDESPSLSQ
jgi:hypothetical protein